MILMLFFAPVLLTGVYLLGRSRAHRETAQRQSSLAKQGGDTEPQADGPSVVDQFLYDRCCRYMADRKPFLVESFSLGDLANVLFTNKVYLSNTFNQAFKAVMQESPSTWCARLRKKNREYPK